MAEYIERELAIKALSRGEGCENVCRRAIEHIPTADVAPVRHGRWISKNHHGYEWVFVCSNCDYVDGYPFNDRPNYCPNCGAKMDGSINNG